MAARDQVTAGLLLRRLAHDGRGGWRHGDARFFLIRPETLIGVQKAVERALGARAAECFVEGGRTGGARVLRSLAGSAEERARALTAMAAELGWGILTLESLTSTSFVVTASNSPFLTLESLTSTSFVVTASNSPFAEAHAATRDPVCHLTRGVLEALAENLFGRPVPVHETHCEAAGASRCRFEAAVDVSLRPAQGGGEMGGTSRSPHSSQS
ncbi:MAG: hypothetical protein AUH30_13815 [Candidatus Rokubacteria bacterium 13_1_40CM_68_15]|nr:MAG: hypothetical protein AUH30_13815 [Candidatus Rokubacteria bacterium 13_1_40CM_68_15]